VTNSETNIVAINGTPLVLSTLIVGETVNIVGTIDVQTGIVTASEIRVML
jgi:hypothetical protein